MKQKRIFGLLWLLLPLASFGQNRHLIDSIKVHLRGKEGLERFELLSNLGWEYRFAYPDSTIYFARTAYALGQKLRLTRDLAKPVNFIGIAYNYKGERLKAFDYFSQALTIALRQQDSLQIAHSNHNIGRLLYEQGVLSKSYAYFVKARSIFTALNDSSGLAYIYQSIANLYKSQRDYGRAEENYLRAYAIRLKLGNPRDIMSALVYLGRHYDESGQLDKSIQFFKLADSAGHVTNDEINLAEIKTYLAEGYMNKGMLKEAEAMCREGLKVILPKQNLRMMPQAYSTLGQILIRRNDLMGAKRYFLMSLDIASRIKDLNSKMEAYYFLWQVSEKQQDAHGSLAHQNQYLQLKDSVKDLDLTRQVERIQFEVEIERKERENELLKSRQARDAAVIQQQRLQNIILVVVVVFVSLLGLLQWLNGKKRRAINKRLILQNEEIAHQREEIIRKNDTLSRHNQQLSDLNHEKDTLMSIVAHDLKSPLSRIEGITYLLEADEKLTEEHREYVGMLRGATRSGLDLITDLLDVHMLEENVEPNYATFDISKFLFEKTEAFFPGAEAKKIHLNITRVENEDVYTDRDYLDRIFENLLSNAIKFSPKNSVVDIAADRDDGEFWISVKDRGPGFSAEDKELLFQKFKKLSARPTGGESSNGLGLAIVKTLVDRLKGKIELVSQQGKGSEFVVRFPQEKQV